MLTECNPKSARINSLFYTPLHEIESNLINEDQSVLFLFLSDNDNCCCKLQSPISKIECLRKKSASQGQQEDGSISTATCMMTSVPNENLELGSSKSAAKVEKRKDAGIKVDVANTTTRTGTELTERRGEKRKKSGESTAAVSEASDATEDDSNEQPPAKKALINAEEVEDDEH